MKLNGLLLLILLLGTLVVLPPTASAAPATIRLFPNSDNNAPVIWQEPCVGMSNQIYFEEVNEWPTDLGTGGCITVNTDSDEFVLGFQNLPGDARSVTSVTLIVVALGTNLGVNGFDIDTSCANFGLANEQWGHFLEVTGAYTTYTTANFIQGARQGCSDDGGAIVFPWTLAMVNNLLVTGLCDVAAGGTCEVSTINVLVTYTVGDGGDGGPPVDVGGGYGTFLKWFDVNYPRRCQDVTIEDTRSEAALAILYIWNFGDGKQEQTTNGSVSHSYEKEGLYTVTVRVQYRSGAIEIFLINVNARGNECRFTEFVNDWFPILLLLIVLCLLAAFIVEASKSRLEKNVRKKLRRLLLLIGLLAFGIMAAVVVYTSAMGIPI
jgi:hypothetical protein